MKVISTKTLAGMIERDILSEPVARPTHNVMECFTCGRAFLYKDPDGDDSGRFCSDRCGEGYDAGFPRFDPLQASKNNPRLYSLPIGPRGFYINCRSCGRVRQHRIALLLSR